MRRWSLLVIMLLPILWTTGCPYETKTSLGDPDPGRFDRQILGRWSGVDAQGDAPAAFLVLPFNGPEYYVELRERDKEPNRFRAYLIDVGGHSLLQLNEIDPDGAPPATYYLARYALDADGALTLNFIGEQIVPKDAAADAKALEAFLTAHWQDPALDDPDTRMILRRPEPPAAH